MGVCHIRKRTPEGVCCSPDAPSMALKYVFFSTQGPRVLTFSSLPLFFYLFPSYLQALACSGGQGSGVRVWQGLSVRLRLQMSY